MRRLIHNLLPTVIDLKVFDEPLALSEHPQIGIIRGDDIELNNNNINSNTAIGILKRFQQQKQQQVQDRQYSVKSDVKSASVLSNFHLLNLTVPDVLINDRELTSIIAYALT